MARMTKEWYEQEARRLFPEVRTKEMTTHVVEIKEHPEVSMGTNPGAWVEAWVWVPDPIQNKCSKCAAPIEEKANAGEPVPG